MSPTYYLYLSAILFAIFAIQMRTGQRSLPAVAYFPLAIAIATWLGGVADISSIAKANDPKNLGGTGGPSKPTKPVPPVNLPFE